MKVSTPNNRKEEKNLAHLSQHLTKEGSLGILAYGDLGLVAWRKIRDKEKTKVNTNL